jgi:hypothetical protein
MAEEKGLEDPYPVTNLTLPEKMPSLVVKLEPLGVEAVLPARIVLLGGNYTGPVTMRGLDLLKASLSGVGGLGRSYLVLVSDPARTDGDALRYTLYAAMCVSWAERGNLSETAPLVFSALNGSLSVSPVEAVVTVRVLPLGLLAAGASGVLLVVAAPLAARENKYFVKNSV